MTSKSYGRGYKDGMRGKERRNTEQTPSDFVKEYEKGYEAGKRKRNKALFFY